MTLRKSISALFCGVLFGVGLSLGGMTDPAKVVAFLDLAGHWDPSLAFVMGGALLLTTPAFRYLLRLKRPMFEDRFVLPTKQDLDFNLLAGSSLFGIGWGITGLCPGPAIVSLATGIPQFFAFVAAMIAGMWLSDRVTQLQMRRQMLRSGAPSASNLSS
jgi:uncharacterized membrane protein YedE/YeeE